MGTTAESLLSGGDDVLGDAIEGISRTGELFERLVIELYLAILEAEAGRKEEVLKHAARLAGPNSALPAIQRVSPNGISGKTVYPG